MAFGHINCILPAVEQIQGWVLQSSGISTEVTWHMIYIFLPIIWKPHDNGFSSRSQFLEVNATFECWVFPSLTVFPDSLWSLSAWMYALKRVLYFFYLGRRIWLHFLAKQIQFPVVIYKWAWGTLALSCEAVGNNFKRLFISTLSQKFWVTHWHLTLALPSQSHPGCIFTCFHIRFQTREVFSIQLLFTLTLYGPALV